MTHDDIDALRTEIDGPIGWLRIDRPESRGSLTRAMWEALPGKLEELAAGEGVRAVVIAGTEGHFVAGADIREFAELRADPELARRYDDGARGTLETLERLPVPSVAMIDGPCVGGGCLIAFACDLRYASARSLFGIPAGKLGLAYPYEGLTRLIEVLGEPTALELLLTGRFVKAPEARELRMVHDVLTVEALEARVRGVVEQIASNAPLSLAYTRRAIRRRLPARLSDEAIEALATACYSSADYQEGVRAFLEKRPPTFQGR